MLKRKETWEIAQKYRRTLKIQNAIGFSDMNIKVPEIDFYEDDEQFFNSGSNIIHIGAYGITENFNVESEEDFLEAVNYVRGHEEEHCRSTAHRPYANGILKGSQEIIKYISSKEDPKPRKFRTDMDFVNYANITLPSMGIYISWTTINSIVAGLANSIEDGRIERIRSVRYPGFDRLRIKFRGIYWTKSTEDFPDYEDIKDDVPEKLRIILNQILMLSTSQVYEKGFAMKYHGTPLMDEVNVFKPHIGRGIIAGNCRDMSREVIEISRILAPYIYETCKLSEKDIMLRQNLENMIRSMIERAVENDLYSPGGNLSENDEKKDDGGIPKSTFPMTDLVVTLPDDVYDKLMENAGDGEEGNILVRREHPKEEITDGENEPDSEKEHSKETSDGREGGKKSSNNESEENGNALSEGNVSDEGGSDVESQTGTGSSSEGSMSEEDNAECGSNSGSSENAKENASKENNEKSGGSDGSSGNSEGSNDSDATMSLSDGNSFEETNTDETSSSAKNDTAEAAGDKKAACESESFSGGNSDKSADDGGSRGRGTSDSFGNEISQAILDAIKEAAERTRQETEETVSNVNTHIAHEHRTREVVPDNEPVLSPKEMEKEIGHRFRELKRAYDVKDRLPSVLQARGRAMFRKNQRYFKSLSKPTVKNLDTGSVDPSRIYGLSFGDTEVFQKIGKDKQFDGCAYMLIDNSGSMCGRKREESAKAGAVVEEGFRKMFPLKIVAFDQDGPIIHEVIKNWDEWQAQNCCWNYALHGRSGFGNEDGFDIMVASKELLARPERKKMLVILSDGAPGNRGLVKQAVKDARKKGIEVYSVYFEEGEISRTAEQVMKEMYEKDYVVCPLSELDDNLYKLFKKFSRS